MTNNYFYEVQKLDSIWPLLVLAVTLITNWVLYFYLGYNDLIVFYFSMASAMIMSSFLWSMRLHTKIDTGGIHYRFFPFQFKWVNVSWKDIKQSDIRKFSAWSEYSGYGIRRGKSGKAFIINGNQGLQLTLQNGDKILIGTSQPDKIKSFLAEKSR